MLNVGGRFRRNGTMTSDITIQMHGPYTAATRSTPERATRIRRIHDELIVRSKNTVDQPRATPTCISTPTSAVDVPPVRALGPRRVDATPWNSRVAVEP